MSHKNFSENKMNRRKPRLAVVLSSVFSVVVVCALAVLMFVLGTYDKEDVFAEKDSIGAEMGKIENEPQIDFTDVSSLEMRGMWIATTINIDYPSKTGLAKAELEKEIEDIVKNAYDLGINTIFFQVRPSCDALYDSDIFPASKYVSGKQGETVEDFDSLAYMLEVAGKYNIDVHAWVNPYRVTMYKSDVEELSDTNPAKINSSYTVEYADGKTYLNPGLPEVRNLVVSGIREIVEKYPKIAGVHFDDYFYPYPVGDADFDDENTYQMYGNGMDKDDWRRSNSNKLVKDAYETVKSINPDCQFGVSVFGVWANKDSDTPVPGSDTNAFEAYFSLYCDALSWAKGGYVDYIIPQNYWSFDTKAAPFDDVARWWNANLDGTGVDLYMGHAAYKSADYAEGEIYKQIEMCRTLSSYKGSVLYGYQNIKGNIGNVADDVKRAFSEKKPRATAESTGQDIAINYPLNNSTSDASKTYVIGWCDPAYPLYVDGVPVSKTTDGYFSVFLELENGKNKYVFSQNDKTKELVVNYKNKPSTINLNNSNKTEKFEILNVYPSKTTWLEEDESLTVSCVAPAGSNVSARIGSTEIMLSPSDESKNDTKGVNIKYTGKVNPTSLIHNTEVKYLGNVEFTAIMGDETATARGGEISRRGADSYVYAEVKEDYTHTKVGTSSSFYDDFLPSSKGMRDYVVDVTDGYCKMRFGGYIAEEELVFTYGKPLLLNTILTTALGVNAEDTTNNKNNSTDIRFGVIENIPVDVDFNGDNGDMRIIIYNTDTDIIPQFEIPANPLVKAIVGKKGTRDNMLVYQVTLKDNKNFYGFNVVYENGCMIVKLNNPQTLALGDKPLSGKRIVVDAGHGGSDGGAPGPGNRPEKVLNQTIATFLAEKLESLGAEIIISRPGDETVDLYQRMDILNEECPDMAISVHHNSIAGSANALKAKGFMALYSNNSGVSLSEIVSDVVCRELARNQKPTAYQKLAVARNHRFPSTLVEMCFISNVEEYQWSVTEGNAEKSADALVKGILEYYRNQEQYLDY